MRGHIYVVFHCDPEPVGERYKWTVIGQFSSLRPCTDRKENERGPESVTECVVLDSPRFHDLFDGLDPRIKRGLETELNPKDYEPPDPVQMVLFPSESEEREEVTTVTVENPDLPSIEASGQLTLFDDPPPSRSHWHG